MNFQCSMTNMIILVHSFIHPRKKKYAKTGPDRHHGTCVSWERSRPLGGEDRAPGEFKRPDGGAAAHSARITPCASGHAGAPPSRSWTGRRPWQAPQNAAHVAAGVVAPP
jgi:hypothetical protein